MDFYKPHRVYYKHETTNFYLKNVFVAQFCWPKKTFLTKFSRQIWAKTRKKLFLWKWLLKLKKLRKPNESRIKFYNMQVFKIQIMTYVDREIIKFPFSQLSAVSNFCPTVISLSCVVFSWHLEKINVTEKKFTS